MGKKSKLKRMSLEELEMNAFMKPGNEDVFANIYVDDDEEQVQPIQEKEEEDVYDEENFDEPTLSDLIDDEENDYVSDDSWDRGSVGYDEIVERDNEDINDGTYQRDEECVEESDGLSSEGFSEDEEETSEEYEEDDELFYEDDEEESETSEIDLGENEETPEEITDDLYEEDEESTEDWMEPMLSEDESLDDTFDYDYIPEVREAQPLDETEILEDSEVSDSEDVEVDEEDRNVETRELQEVDTNEDDDTDSYSDDEIIVQDEEIDEIEEETEDVEEESETPEEETDDISEELVEEFKEMEKESITEIIDDATMKMVKEFETELNDFEILFDKVFANKGNDTKINLVDEKRNVTFVVSNTYDPDEVSKLIGEVVGKISQVLSEEEIKDKSSKIFKFCALKTMIINVIPNKPKEEERDTYLDGIKKMVHEGLDQQHQEMVEKDKEYGEYYNKNKAIKDGEVNPKFVLNILNNENDSVFDEQKALDIEFREGPFYAILKQVMSKERLVDVPNTPIKMSVTINQLTKFFTVVDFNTGFRVICIDTDQIEQLYCNPFIVSNQFPFSYQREVGGPNNFKLRFLYKDSCEEKPVAVVRRLQKLIAQDYINEKFKVKLFGNYVVGYTTDVKAIDNFETGDGVGSKGNSPYVVGKPHTNRIGILVIEKKTDKYKAKNNGSSEIQTYDFARNYDLITVASCRYITDDRSLNDINAEMKYVRYTITEYNEINSCMIEDGLIACIKAISMEHDMKYGLNVQFSIEYELDRANIQPVSVDRLISDGRLLLLSQSKPYNEFGVKKSKILPRENRIRDISYDRGRLDPRFLSSPMTISNIFPPNIVNNYNIIGRGKEGLNEFIKGRGYLDCNEPEPITFDIDPFQCGMEFQQPHINEMFKIDVNALNSLDNQEFNKLRIAQMRFETNNEVKEGSLGSLMLNAFDFFDTISGLKD